MLSWIFIVLSNWSNSPRYMLIHSDTLSWYQTNQFWYYSLSCLLSREALNVKFTSLRFEPTKPTIYHTNMWQVYIHITTFFQVKTVNFQSSKESSISSKSYLYVQRCLPDTKWWILPGYRYRGQHRHHMFLESNWSDWPTAPAKKYGQNKPYKVFGILWAL